MPAADRLLEVLAVTPAGAHFLYGSDCRLDGRPIITYERTLHPVTLAERVTVCR